MKQLPQIGAEVRRSSFFCANRRLIFSEEIMPELPAVVLEYLRRLVFSQSRPAYLLTDPSGTLMSWGGDIEAYGLGNLTAGEPVNQQVCILEGLLPLTGEAVSLSCVQIDSGRPVDLYLFSTPDGDCALL